MRGAVRALAMGGPAVLPAAPEMLVSLRRAFSGPRVASLAAPIRLNACGPRAHAHVCGETVLPASGWSPSFFHDVTLTPLTARLSSEVLAVLLMGMWCERHVIFTAADPADLPSAILAVLALAEPLVWPVR